MKTKYQIVKFLVMSDLHLGSKPWQVRKALRMCVDADAVLLAGDLTNDGTPEQIEKMKSCVEELLPDIPVLAVAGNHDYPVAPVPLVDSGICDYPQLQEWLLERQPYPYEADKSGAWAVRMNHIEIIGLNAATHWRRFKFPEGRQLTWLDEHLKRSDVKWHIILCHAPLLAHNPVRNTGAAYLSRDDQLQRIVDANRNIIFISGHTHVSWDSSQTCIEQDEERNNLYINDGSIRPTTVLDVAGKPTGEAGEGNLIRLVIEQ